MRQQCFCSLVLSALLLAPILVAAPEALRAHAHEGVVYTSDQTWSGNMTLDDDVSIASGATLFIQPGTHINVTEDITITILGDLQIQGTQESPVNIWGSWVAETSVQARWQGFLLDSGSVSTASHATISDSRGGFDVESGADLTIDSTFFVDSIIGVWNKGSISGAGFECQAATTSCLRVDGVADLNTVTSTTSASAVHISNGGIASIDLIHSNQDSDVLALDGGSTFTGQIDAGGFTRMIRASDSVTATVTSFVSTSGETLVDASSLSGLNLVNGNSTNATISSLLIGSIDDLEFSSVSYLCDGTTNCIDAQIDGELILRDSSFGQQNSTADVFARFRGNGNVVMNNISLVTNSTLFDIAGAGELGIDASHMTANSIGTISGWDFEMSTSTVMVEDDGLLLLDVESSIADSQIARTFSMSDSTSVGLRAVWSHITMESVTITGWNDGIRCESECILMGTTVNSGGGGRNSGSGFTVDGGMIQLQSVETSASDIGIDVIQGSVHIENWTVDMAHRTYGIQLANDAIATIRSMPSYTSSGAHDGFGDGTLLWGSIGTPDLAISIEESFTESTITVTDLVGQTIMGASVTSHGYSEISDASGQVTLPLLSSGSHVAAEEPSSGMGSSAMISPPGGSLQIAVVPGTGDWNIPAGVDARLTSGIFVLDGNLTIESTATLTLVDATLLLPHDAILTIESNGLLKGDNGTLDGGTTSLTAGVPLRGEGQGLTLNTDVTFICYDPWTWVNTSISGALHLNQDCELTLAGGHASGTVTVEEDASLTQRSYLSVTVLDAGEPADDADVAVDGWIQSTDQNGKAETWFTWKTVDDEGETITDSQRTVIIQYGELNRYKSWIPTSNAEMEVMISTIKEEVTTNSLRLESVFSPWHLGHDLVVSAGTTLEIMADTELSLAPEIGIEIAGTTLAGNAWVGGYNSAGITVTSGGHLQIASTLYSGGPITVLDSGTASLSSVTVTDAPLTVSNNGILEIIDGTISQTDICIRATGTLNMHGTSITGCDMYAIWATDATLWVEDIDLGTGSSNGAWIQQSVGTLSGWMSTNFDGDGAVLFLQMVDGDLTVTDMTLSTGIGESALRIEGAEEFEMSDSTISGAPAVYIQESELRLTRVDLTGSGVGDGITIHGTPSGGTIIDDCDIDDYETALRMTGDIDEATGTGVSILNSHLHAPYSISSVNIPFSVEGGELDGTIYMDGLEKPWSANVIDHDNIEVEIIGDATLYVAHTWLVSAPQGTTLSMIIPEFDFTLGEQQFEWLDPGQLILIHEAHTDSGMTDAWAAQWSATAAGYLPLTGQLQLDTTGQRLLSIELTVNAPPVVTIETPQAMEINAGQLMNYSAIATDSNGDEIVEWVWVFESGDYTLLVGDTPSGTISDTEQGEWLLRATAIDVHGAEGTATVAITVNAADADNDYIDSCPSTGPNAWWDALNNRFCGPDVFDVDDDNDNFRDDVDLFPFDSCAHHDTDDDGLPNSVSINCETDLVADDDDDGDGVPDSEDVDPLDPGVGAFSQAEDRSLIATLCSPAIVLSLGLLILFSTFAYLRYNADIGRED